MVEISKAEQWVIKLYPENAENAEMALSHYAIVVEYEGGYVLHHTITWSMYYMTAEEYANILENEELKRVRIVLDKNIDEDTIAEKAFLKRAEWPYEFTYTKANSFVIFTTTACNARCPYCYEKGIKTIRMTKKVAEDVVQFIKRVHTRDISIRWFGGEPLLNTEIIDYICSRLKEENIGLTSTMISNSSLLYKYADRLKDWNLKRIQITLDGVGEKYDKIKNYVNTSGSTFEDVVKGIHAAVANDVFVSIRINVSLENIDTLDEIASFIRDNFNEYITQGKLGVNVGRIFGVMCEESGEQAVELNQKIFAAAERNPDILSDELVAYPEIIKKKNLSYCSASKGGGVVINPIGKISPCEHWKDYEVIGDVVSGLTDHEKAEEWRIKSGENIAFCKEHRCPLMPTCIRYRKCDALPYCKNEHRMEVQIEEKRKSIRATYKYFLDKINKKP